MNACSTSISLEVSQGLESCTGPLGTSPALAALCHSTKTPSPYQAQGPAALPLYLAEGPALALHLAASTCRLLQAPRPSHPQLISSFSPSSTIPTFLFPGISSARLSFIFSVASSTSFEISQAVSLFTICVFDRPFALLTGRAEHTIASLFKSITKSTRLHSHSPYHFRHLKRNQKQNPVKI